MPIYPTNQIPRLHLQSYVRRLPRHTLCVTGEAQEAPSGHVTSGGELGGGGCAQTVIGHGWCPLAARRSQLDTIAEIGLIAIILINNL